MRNKKLWSILLLVIPLAIGIPLAIYVIPSTKIKTEPPLKFNPKKESTQKDSVNIKLNLIYEKLNQLDIRLKKIEAAKTIKNDTLGYSSKSRPQQKSIKDKTTKQESKIKTR